MDFVENGTFILSFIITYCTQWQEHKMFFSCIVKFLSEEEFTIYLWQVMVMLKNGSRVYYNQMKVQTRKFIVTTPIAMYYAMLKSNLFKAIYRTE